MTNKPQNGLDSDELPVNKVSKWLPLPPMPKVTTTRTRSEGSSSPAKTRSPAAKKKDNPGPAVTDPSTWPESKISPKEKITAGDINKYYHLGKAVYSRLNKTEHTTDAGFVAHLYNEREVEQAAWEKYGGPEGYAAHLETLRKRQSTQSPQKTFLTPASRKIVFDVQIISAPSRSRLHWTSDPLPPVLQPIRAYFPEWLWKKCNEALDPKHEFELFGPGMKLTERARLLGIVAPNQDRGSLNRYPRRPSEPLATSESINELRALLERAPQAPAPGDDGFAGDVPGMVRDDGCWPDWDISYEWDGEYFDEVIQALIEVVKEHGVGKRGWSSARWEVYDTYAECVSGICRNGEWWSDGAEGWLDASIVEDRKLGKELIALIEGSTGR